MIIYAIFILGGLFVLYLLGAVAASGLKSNPVGTLVLIIIIAVFAVFIGASLMIDNAQMIR